MTRPRDNQQTKVWNALRDVQSNRCPHYSAKDLQRIANKLTKSAWFARRTEKKSSQAYSVLSPTETFCQSSNYARLGVEDHNVLGLLHQMAHYMLPENVAWHGVEFTRLLLDLVQYVGLDPHTDKSVERRKEDRDYVKQTFNAFKVRWRAHLRPEARAARSAAWRARDLQNLRAELTGEAS